MQIECYKFLFLPEIPPEAAWEALVEAGATVLYSSTGENDSTEIYGQLPGNCSPEKLLHQLNMINSIISVTLPEIDWEAQWAAHGNDYHDGYVHINLIDFGYSLEGRGVVRLIPGPGFGDLSHPTTQLMIRLMTKHINKQFVIDVGCGSGVLSCCAIAMGAEKVIGLDIDPNAIEHAKQNALLNGMQDRISFSLPSEIGNALILMNMIQAEQVAAWESLPQIHASASEVITSGILENERQAYLEQCERWGWKLKEEIKQDEWRAFYWRI